MDSPEFKITKEDLGEAFILEAETQTIDEPTEEEIKANGL